jgi:hypothetical protein
MDLKYRAAEDLAKTAIWVKYSLLSQQSYCQEEEE